MTCQCFFSCIPLHLFIFILIILPHANQTPRYYSDRRRNTTYGRLNYPRVLMAWYLSVVQVRSQVRVPIYFKPCVYSLTSRLAINRFVVQLMDEGK